MLKHELSTRPSTEEAESLRRQLKALHQLEFNVQDGDSEHANASGGSG